MDKEPDGAAGYSKGSGAKQVRNGAGRLNRTLGRSAHPVDAANIQKLDVAGETFRCRGYAGLNPLPLIEARVRLEGTDPSAAGGCASISALPP